MGEPEEEHLLLHPQLQRNATAAGLHLTTLARLRGQEYMWSQNVCRLDVSFLVPRRVWPAGRVRV